MTTAVTRRFLCVASVLVSAVGGACIQSDGGTTAAELRQRIEGVVAPADFAFRFRAGGTRVNDCFFPNPEFAGQVDAERELLVVSRAPGETPIVISSLDATFLHSSLFAEGTVKGEWLRLTQRGEAVADSLNRVLGPDLAAYAAPGAFPPSGQATAVALLEVATKVTPLGTSVIRGQRGPGFRLVADLDGRPRGGGESTVRGAASTDRAEFDIWLSPSDEVVRIEVRPTPVAEAEGDESPPGWLTDYDPAPQDIGLDPPADAPSVGPEALARLGPRRLASCDLPI